MALTKSQVRKRMAEQLRALTPEGIARHSDRIRGRLFSLPEIERASSIFIYVSIGREVETHRTIQALFETKKSVAVPRITDPGMMEAHRIRTTDDLVPGTFGILEPRAPRLLAGTPDVTICPGVAFTCRGDRLGRGQAYYDRFLSRHPETLPVALCFEDQILDDLPTEDTDYRVRIIVTERRVLRV